MLSTPITSTGVRRTQNLTARPTQNTAPVLEFQCLFTFDLRRKQKRWQDGFLRFHTFNKRIMVYDSPSGLSAAIDIGRGGKSACFRMVMCGGCSQILHVLKEQIHSLQV